ncbi:MAG: hypothetical protein QOF48_8 [Verrucomicrobiota bacterium]|jgi:hypothetical protein
MSESSKPPVMWSTLITRWAVLLLIVVVVIIALRPTAAIWLAGPNKFHTSGDPANIRLVGVAPDGENILLDPWGRPLPEGTFVWNGTRTLSWSPQEMQRDLLFEMGPGTEDLDFLADIPGTVKASNNGGWVNSSSVAFGSERGPAADSPRRILVRLTFNEKYWRRGALFGSHQRQVEEVDFDLHFFSKQRGPAQLSFEGPFTAGQTNIARENFATMLIVVTNGLSTDSAGFRIWRASLGAWGLPVFAYDTNGKRHIPQSRTSLGGTAGWTNEFVVPGVPLAKVAAICVAEQPRVKTFHNILVNYPDRPAPAFSPVLLRLATALGQTNQPANAIEHFSPRTPQDAMTMLEFIPGSRNAMNSLAHSGPGIGYGTLSAEQRERLRQLAMAWTRQTDLNNRALGLRVGLRGSWPEFTVIALQRLTNGTPAEQSEAAAALASHPAGTGPDQLPLLVGLAKTNGWPDMAPDLVRIIQHIGGPEAQKGLMDLARADHPIVWWSAIARLELSAFKSIDPLSEEMLQRLWMVQGRANSALSSNALVAARARLAGMLTMELRDRSYSVFEQVFKRITKSLDQSIAMAAITKFLHEGKTADWQRIQPAEIVRQINLWYGKDFGGLGDGVKRSTGYPNYDAWPGVIEDVLEFCDKQQREGKIGPATIP